MFDESTFYVRLGGRIREARIKQGLTQKDLAGRLSLTRTSITNVERGRQKLLLHSFVQLAAALRVTPGQLLGDDVPPATPDADRLDELLKGLPRTEQAWVKTAFNIPIRKGR